MTQPIRQPPINQPPINQLKPRVAARPGKKSSQDKPPAKLLVAMTGKASAAKAATGDEPVFAYIASLPQPQRGIAERIDAVAAKSLPGIQRAVKWGMAYYEVDEGWCFSSGAFVGHVKLMFNPVFANRRGLAVPVQVYPQHPR